ncbi:unnamed protein product [Ilex paraguariensis]|uniref:Uncharacterized protein n=1 Tax=Ilex paraguariensis TaxID=185542 RepID=A0ABC8URA6_9AQUA
MAGVAAMCGGDGAPFLALKLYSSLLYVPSIAVLMVMNKIQPERHTRASLLGGELVNQDDDPGDMNSFKGNEEMGVIFDQKSEGLSASRRTKKRFEEREKQRRPVGRVGKERQTTIAQIKPPRNQGVCTEGLADAACPGIWESDLPLVCCHGAVACPEIWGRLA